MIAVLAAIGGFVLGWAGAWALARMIWRDVLTRAADHLEQLAEAVTAPTADHPSAG